MRDTVKIFLLFAFFCAAAAYCFAVDAWVDRRRRRTPLQVAAFLTAIREVESGDRFGAVGARGERTAYQFMAATWAEYTAQDFSWASRQPALAETVAKMHLRSLRESLRRRGFAESPENLAAAWRHGAHFSPEWAEGDYAHRVTALYWAEVEGNDTGDIEP